MGSSTCSGLLRRRVRGVVEGWQISCFDMSFHFEYYPLLVDQLSRWDLKTTMPLSAYPP